MTSLNGSALHSSKDGQLMLNLVDKLRSIERIRNTIPLPQIVVIGQQSSGKSSVLNAISGIQFPVGSGVCTQFPTEIILRRDDMVRAKASIRHPSNVDNERRSRIREFENKWQHTELSKLQDIVSEAKEVLQLNDRNRFSKESLVLEISGPEQEHLTLIDLPGIIVSTETNQSSSDIDLVNSISDEYASNNRAVVLAVISAKNDPNNHLILQKLKLNPDLRNRTLGVITGPDATEDSDQEEKYVQLVQQDSRGLGHGWHVLRNLKPQEVKEGAVSRDAVETQFFQQNAPWNRLIPTSVGSQALRTRLSAILKDKISESLPQIQQEVKSRLKQIEAELKSLGEPRQSPEELRDYLTKCADSFYKDTSTMLQGLPPVPMNGLIHQTQSLRARVQNLYRNFATDMFERAQTWNLHSQSKDGVESLYRILKGGTDTKEVALISSQVMTTWLSGQMSRHQGRHQADLVHLDWATAIFQLKAQRWRHIAETHCRLIFDEVASYLEEAIYDLVDDAVAYRLWHEIIEPALRQRNEMLHKKVEELHYPYTLPSIHCVNRGYDRWLATTPFSNNLDASAECCNMLRSAEAFYSVTVDVFTDNVITLGVECCLLDGLPKILNARLFYNMPAERLRIIGGESDEAKERRSLLSAEKAQFEEARDRILPALGTPSSAWKRSRQDRPATRIIQRTVEREPSDKKESTSLLQPSTSNAASLNATTATTKPFFNAPSQNPVHSPSGTTSVLSSTASNTVNQLDQPVNFFSFSTSPFHSGKRNAVPMSGRKSPLATSTRNNQFPSFSFPVFEPNSTGSPSGDQSSGVKSVAPDVK